MLFAAGIALVVAGCFGGGGDTETTQATIPGQGATTATASTMVEGEEIAGEPDALSTFKAKDPFIAQGGTAVSSTTVTTSPTGSTGSTTRPTSYTTTSWYVTTTIPWGTTTTTKKPATTTTTAPHAHTLKVLSISQVNGAAAVTFQVDSSVYKDKRIGDVVSTSWGQVKVLDLSSSSKVATLLHGSETLVLSVGQMVYE